uniref:Cytochrome c oxidase subunit 3 n=1 Tax=Andrena chekiangensis TaxID=2572772 RepID=A0A4D6SRY8_9HYME|nr:cytochrome c oxidase subunit III [Andrena chekiangensis]QCG69815.1 cytochrome c oxidase subunit III [Andrena chekiangensis]
MSNSNHPFHMVTLSPWPMLTSINIMNTFMSMIIMFNLKMKLLMIISMATLIMCIIQWWRDVIRESTFQGFHTFTVTKLIKMSMILFIISELLFFVAFFWTYFHSSITPSIEIGMNWPPSSINQFNPYNIPLLNSIILISSGITITWSHHALMSNKALETKVSMFMTIILGVYFTMLQIFEYLEAPFCFNDSVYGSIFFMTTGFHGSHVNIGLIFLVSCFTRMMKNHFSKMHHLNFETASWYWHFVDIIWLFVYITIYWWNY